MGRLPVWVVGLAVLTACNRNRLDEGQEGGLRWLSGVVTTRGDGIARVKFKMEPGETAFLATSQASGADRTHVAGVIHRGDLVFDAFAWSSQAESKTNGAYVAEVASVNWPTDGSDPKLEEGKVVLELGVVDASNNYLKGELALDVLIKKDASFTEGTVHAVVVYGGGIDQDPVFVQATEEAVAMWQSLYADIGLNLEVSYDTTSESALEAPALGSPEVYEELSAERDLRAVTVVIVPEILNSEDIYGIAGDIPGPLVATDRSAVAVSSLLASGPDGRFDAEEQRLFAETLAHEVGHYLGLFHPVEVAYDAWDALEDTEKCDNEADCLEALSENLMFPFPVCGFVRCVPQDQLTEDQAAVAHRHVAVD